MRYLLLVAIFMIVLMPIPAFADCDGYTVRSGDTLSKIARANNTTYMALADINSIKYPYRIYIGQCLRLPSNLIASIIINPDAKGLAMATNHPEDLQTLGVRWYYVWSDGCSAPCIPMVRSMQLPINCADIILVGNEPNAVEPYGAPISPTDAVKKVKAIESRCPHSKLVVGNVSIDNWGTGTGRTWLLAFLKAYPNFKQAIGVHCYTQNSGQWCIDQLKSIRGIYRGEMWVTEFGVLSGDTIQFKILLDYIASNFTRYAAYTNRQPHTGEGWEIAAGVELINGDGTLSPIGKIYAEKN